MCPVHTPDGAPCGLLNHLARACVPTVEPATADQCATLLALLYTLGVQRYDVVPSAACMDVILDGQLVGFLPLTTAAAAVEQLRVS